MRKGILLTVLVAVLAAGGYVLGMYFALYGEHRGPGRAEGAALPGEVVQERDRAQQRTAAGLSPAPSKQILFGDLHVHTTFSPDAFVRSLPMMGGPGGAHPVGDACDYARYCSALDFWSINDHAEATTPRKWDETKESIRACNALAGDPETPDVAAFLGWEWSQVGTTPETHYGHKNVVLRHLDDERVPARPIGAAGVATDALRANQRLAFPPLLPLLDFGNRQDYYDFLEYVDEIRRVPACETGVPSNELPADCYESAATPRELFEKLDQWGHEAIVIPHGNTWGFYSPPTITWDKQLKDQDDPDRQILVEVFSGHGNSEEYRDWRAGYAIEEGGEISADNAVCPEPTRDYLPQCWRAGELIRERCLAAGEEAAECSRRAEKARLDALLAGPAAHLTVPGATAEDWLDSGQCRDCFLPSFSYRPGGSTQYAMAISNFDGEDPRRFRWGFIASSDNHSARPGTGYKEHDRFVVTDATGPQDPAWAERLGRGPFEDDEPVPRSRSLEVDDIREAGLRALDAERQASFFTSGGLAAVHADGRSRDAVWEAMQRREVYGTSGERILLWFHLLNAERPDGSFGPVPMGGEVSMGATPRFEVRAAGSFEQEPGCPDHAVRALSADRLEKLCRGECFNPGASRELITRIEVIRIRPQTSPDEEVAVLVEDPWRVLPCDPDPAGCVVQFADEEYAEGGRDALYYVRAIQEPRPVVNGGNLRCTYDDEGRCVEVDPCYGDFRTPADDLCLTSVEPRAWSSPIYLLRP